MFKMNSSNANIILPEEMLLEIFTYLPLSDRKNIRLTCLRFYEICNCSHLLESEELVFLGNFNTNAAIESLTISERKSWNIKLKKAPLMDDSILPFFQNQGTNICSLVFEYCIIKPALLKNILQSCENLRSFALCLRAGDHAQKQWVSVKENIFHVFDTLRKNGTIRQHVTDFSFTFTDFRTSEYSVLTNGKLNDFFIVFPNIKKLKLNLCGNYNYHEPDFEFSQSSSSVLVTDSEFLLSSIYDQIYKIRHQLEMLSITYSCYNCNTFKRNCPSFGILNKITTIDMKNMKSLSLHYKNLWNNSIMYPLLQLEFLSHFECTIGSRDDKVTDVLQVILNTAPNLKYLKMNISYTYVIDRNCFQLLVRSKLKWLVILDSIMKINFEHSSVGDSLLPNNSLTNFYVKISSSDDTTLSLFATFFHGLRELFLENFQVQIISTILKYQTKLQSLTLNNCKNFRIEYSSEESSLQHWLRNEGQLHRKFHNLTYLHVIGFDCLYLSEFLLSEFVFPKLRSFVIAKSAVSSGPHRIRFNFNPLIQTIQKLTELEHVNIKLPVEIYFPQLLSLFGNLSKLRYFIILDAVSDTPWSDLEYRQLFHVCPSLRVLDHNICKIDPDCVPVFYVKDVFTNNIVKLSEYDCSKNDLIPPPS